MNEEESIVGIEVFVADEQDQHPVDIAKYRLLAERVVGAERKLRRIGGTLEVSLVFVDEVAIGDLNERFRNVAGPTDVLSFPMDDAEEERPRAGRIPDGGSISPTGPKAEDFEGADDLPVLLGDVVIAPAVAAANAPELAGNYEDELALLVVHGILHLFGMDHEASEDAVVMEARERELLREFYGEVRAHTWPESHAMGDQFEDEEEEEDIDLTAEELLQQELEAEDEEDDEDDETD